MESTTLSLALNVVAQNWNEAHCKATSVIPNPALKALIIGTVGSDEDPMWYGFILHNLN